LELWFNKALQRRDVALRPCVREYFLEVCKPCEDDSVKLVFDTLERGERPLTQELPQIPQQDWYFHPNQVQYVPVHSQSVVTFQQQRYY